MKPVICIFFSAVLASPALAQGNDPELQRIADMGQHALQEGNKFREAGKPGAPNDPARSWSAVFWKYREEHPGTPAATEATSLAFAWMCFSDQNDELIAKARTLPLDDPAWQYAIGWPLREASRKKGDYAPFYERARLLLSESKDNKLRAQVQLSLGCAYRNQGEPDQAIAAFQAASREAPNSVQAEDAERYLYEMKSLREGQPTPAFEAKTIDDKRISSADLRGKVVLLNFWASW